MQDKAESHKPGEDLWQGVFMSQVQNVRFEILEVKDQPGRWDGKAPSPSEVIKLVPTPFKYGTSRSTHRQWLGFSTVQRFE